MAKKNKRWWTSINRFTSNLGSDYSTKYTTRKKVEFYVMKANANEVAQLVLFKPFLEELSYDFSIQTKEFGANATTGNPDQYITGQDGKIKVTLHLPAVSLNEAKNNAKKVDFFLRSLSTDDIGTLLNNSVILEQTVKALKQDAADAEKERQKQQEQQQNNNQIDIDAEENPMDAAVKRAEQQAKEEQLCEICHDTYSATGQLTPLQAEAKLAMFLNANMPAPEISEEDKAVMSVETVLSFGQKITAEEKLEMQKFLNPAVEVGDDIQIVTTPVDPAALASTKEQKALLANSIYAAYGGSENSYYVHFTNMIQSGKYKKKLNIVDYSDADVTYQNMKKYGFYCSIMDISVDVDLDMGFFEQTKNKFLWPKMYKISFTCDLLNAAGGFGSPEKNIVGFGDSTKDPENYAALKKTNKEGKEVDNPEPNYHRDDVKSWPFGLNLNSGLHGRAIANMGKDYSSNYIENKTGMIHFMKYNHDVSFKPYLNNFSIKRKIDSKNVVESKSLQSKSILVFDTRMPAFSIGFDVVANSVSEAVVNQEKLQRLLRMVWAPQASGQTKKAQVHVKFSNLLNKGTILGIGQATTDDSGLRVVCKGVSFKPDLDMGFFEHGGLLFMKSYSLSFDLETVDSSLLIRI